jgi:poly(hydroxyalkanoate) depolymerase family esterase
MSIHTISNTIDAALKRAGLDTRTGSSKAVVDTIRHALEAAHITQQPSADAAPRADVGEVVDIDARVVPDVAREDARPTEPATAPTHAEAPTTRPSRAPARGQFLSHRHTSAAGSRAYKVYVPASARTEPMPLLVMLHGCQQNPDDFATGTRANEWAEALGWLVAYPAQSSKANGSNCWQWFEPQAQTRRGTEPAIIAGIVRDVCAAHAVDERRIYVAGLSAGAAMAVILGETYPDLFAAVGAHSGLPYRAAHDVPSAFAAMQGRALGAGPAQRAAAATRGVPTIVFHGDRDSTVVLHNGAAIAMQAVKNLIPQTGPLTRTEESEPSAGHGAARVTHVDGEGVAWVEQWTIHGGGHAWSGGDAAGSFTDAQGPDASREMLRFFMQHQLCDSTVAATAK